MKQTASRLAEVQVAGAMSLAPSPSSSASGPAFLVHLPEGVTVAVPVGFDGEEVLVLLTVVREALR